MSIGNSYSQNTNFFSYHEALNNAELAYLRTEYQTSDSIINNTFITFKKGFADDYLFAARNAVKLNNKELALNYLIQGVENGLILQNIKSDSIYKYLKKEINTNRFRKLYRNERKNYLYTLNGDLRKEIAKMVKVDQKYRSWRYNNKPWKTQQQLLKTVDSLNFTKFIEICEKHGFPGKNLVGDDGGFGLVDVPVLLRHMDSTKLKQLEPFVMISIKNGHFEPFAYVSALDYTSMFKTTIESKDENGNQLLIIQQKHGTITGFEDNKLFIYPLKSLSEADLSRRKFGLESMKDYAYKKGCELPIEGIYKKVF